MSTARRRPLGHGPQQHDTTAVVRDAQPHRIRASEADVDLTPMRLARALKDDLARFRQRGILGPQSTSPS